ncbi:hypothetical protein K474DRAFT_309615 [Panus rudis PR-1116 ss-1]|nr:hypothetical protein K474DRAFT_309615 [Panus rudis PR-1116 ss-1]
MLVGTADCTSGQYPSTAHKPPAVLTTYSIPGNSSGLAASRYRHPTVPDLYHGVDDTVHAVGHCVTIGAINIAFKQYCYATRRSQHRPELCIHLFQPISQFKDCSARHRPFFYLRILFGHQRSLYSAVASTTLIVLRYVMASEWFVFIRFSVSC